MKIRVTRTIVFESCTEDEFDFDCDEYADGEVTDLIGAMEYDKEDVRSGRVDLDELSQYEEVRNETKWEIIEDE